MNSVLIGIVDYGIGNLHSVSKGLQKAGAQVKIVNSPRNLERYDGLVLPGVGSFDPVVRTLRKHGFEIPLKIAVARGQPLLGICLGLQILFESSSEGDQPGLGILAGKVQRFTSEPGLKIPHMGWNQLQLNQNIPIWRELKGNTWVYFVHSYYVVPEDISLVSATVTHGTQKVTASISKGTLVATQFHPEKSANTGLQILRNFVDLVKKRDEAKIEER
ncbi:MULTISPECIES: imidazole glycerol phosphate synthase subunit HisH [unclassified Roseofilum]|uniref:imidazole glycerol phosphate synthase subunit HisH n=1 Tax=unclassified Roseofilum TaxID=2620099 RepID=UPI000E8AB8BA|nr:MULTISPECIES: imidazole glycerol phosphate synthase subunit HisH [unclassified Roseofilum]MBP0011381.1 imidazole glycerol phosphate synthase subunit HisH [Roseofilum sp. Belize Diploria]MBP0035910.1 imidazole glycerol phosphate synthase subunit HisH [Roseofilum sp. Belize BBD 4]HBQ98166.1 imidazole glycerol phosphate synthase subunit HisH [Cyanobacteria bacterium UBA11691]